MVRRKLPIILDVEEGNKLLKASSTRYPTGIRNKAIISLILNCGFRVSEIVNLKPGDISLTKGILRVVNGKGGKDRDLAMPEYTQDLLKRWRSVRPKGEYFFSTLKSTQLSSRYIGAFTVRYSKKAKIGKKNSPHTLRHSYVRIPAYPDTNSGFIRTPCGC